MINPVQNNQQLVVKKTISKLFILLFVLLSSSRLLAWHTVSRYPIVPAQTSDNPTLQKITQASEANRGSINASVNADGSKTAFMSDSDFLNQGIPDGQNEIWLFDNNTASLNRITTASTSGRDSSQPSISGDGTQIVFSSNSDFLNQGINQLEIWLYDTTNLTFTRVTNSSDPTRSSERPHISNDGNWIVFQSNADFLNQGISENQTEVWLYNVKTPGLTRLTTASATDRSSLQPRINADGSKVVFASDSDFLGQGIPFDQPEVWLLDVGSMNLSRITTASTSGRVSYAPDIDYSGTQLVFQSNSDFLNQGIVSGQMEIWRYDTALARLFRVTTASPALIPIGDSTAPRISGNGRFIIFESANDFTGQDRMGTIEVWLFDSATNSTQQLTTAPNGSAGFSHTPDINETGLSAAFHSTVDFTNGTTQSLPNEIWLYQSSASATPELLMNFTTGAPNSVFSVTGQNFPSNSTATITVNGRSLGTVPVDANGRFSFLLTTSNATEGTYYVTASVNPSASKQFVLSTTDPIRPQENTGDTFDVPAGIAFTKFIYLPTILR